VHNTKRGKQYGVSHVAVEEWTRKEVKLESGTLPQKMRCERKMMNKNEYNKLSEALFL
jgi:hypothetical protein